jgi:hypothetical protein
MRLGVLLPVLLGLAALAAPSVPAADRAATVAGLIDQLGHQEFAEREKASRDLEALGPAALEPLRQAARSDDPEVRRRAGDLVRRLEARLLSEKILAPTRVRLNYKDVPLRTAVEDLQRRTGLRLALHDPENKLAERRVTLDTGDAPLWEAFEEFCRKAGLVEGESGEVKPGAAASAPAVAPGVQAAMPVFPGGPIQAAQVQVQVQAGGQAVTVATVRPVTAAAALTLADGQPRPLPTHVAGAVRVRALPPGAAARLPKAAEELPVVLQLLPEPKLQWRNVLAVRLERAVDDQGQHLTRASSAGNIGPRGRPPVEVPTVRNSLDIPYQPLPAQAERVALRLKKGERPSKRLRELSGTILAQVQTEPESLITVDRLLQSSGRTVKGEQGGVIRVVKADRADSGAVTLHVQVENPPDVVPAGLRRPTSAPPDAAPTSPYAAGHNGLNLLDDKGNPLPLLPLQTQVQANGATVVWDYTFLYQPQQDRGEPARLVFAGTRTVTVGIPFTLADVPLP